MATAKKPIVTLETGLYILALVLGLGFRLLDLGKLPLGDHEADLALQALDISRGGSGIIGTEPGYLGLTSILFFLFGSSEWLARIWSVIAGTLLIAAPVLFKHQIGREAALILTYFLAFDPAMVVVSRLADGRVLAVAGLALGLGWLLNRDTTKSGISLGIAILGGATIWQGGLGVCLAWIIFKSLIRYGKGNHTDSIVGAFDPPGLINNPKTDIKKIFLWSLGTFLVVGSLFMFKPTLLSGMAGSLLEFIRGLFGAIPGSSLPLVFFAWMISTPFGIVLGMAEVVHARRTKDSTSLFLGWWWVVALLLTFFNPGRQVVDLVWQAIPMLALAARSAARIFNLRGEKKVFFAYAVIAFVLLASIWLIAVGAISAWNENDQYARLASLIASLFLLIAVTFLIIWGWGIAVTWRGFRIGGIAILALFTLSGTWRAAGLGPLPENEIWRIDPFPQDGGLLMASLNDLSLWKTGRSEVLEIGLMEFTSPAMAWNLRNYRTVTHVGEGSVNHPPILITEKRNDFGAATSYSGQALTWNSTPAWSEFSANQWLKWMTFRDAPMTKQVIQLWVRTDIFPGGTTPNLGR